MDFVDEIVNIQYPILPGLLLTLLVGLAVYFCWSPLQRLFAHWHLNRLINQVGVASIRNAYVPDGLGDVIYIERLILQADSLLLLTVKPFRGNIFAAEQIDLWTQVVGHRSYKFPNPLHQQETDLQALQAILPDHPIKRLVVFAKGSRFPKGKPDDVCLFSDLKAMAEQQKDKAVNAEMQITWQSLSQQAEPATNMQHSAMFHQGDKKKLTLGILSGLVAIVYTLWYLGVLV